MPVPRIIDATLPAVWRGTTTPLDRDAVALLTRELPVNVPGTRGSVPLVAHDAFGHDALLAVARRAAIVEPMDTAALATVAGIVAARSDPLVVVHPEPLPEVPRAVAGVEAAEGLVWERRLVLPADTAPRSVPHLVDEVLGRLPGVGRLRVEDPHGVLDLDVAAQLARHREAARLTVLPSDRQGIATALARTLLAAPSGPAVVATLLGRAPHGAAAIEHLVAAPHVQQLRPAVEALALATSRPVPPEHPHWGRHVVDGRVVHPDRLDMLVRHHLDQWDLVLGPAEHERLMQILRARLRPGDRLDGPTLWATLATVTDLRQHAHGSDHAEAHP